MGKQTADTLIALITGAGSGIGLAIGRGLASQGYRVLISDVNLEAAESAASSLIQQGFLAEAVKLNVTSAEDIALLVSRFPRIDILVNNAGMQHVSKLEEFPEDRWRLMIDIMLVAPAMLTRALLPSMRSHNYGRIVNIGSIHALVASPFKSAYVAAKHGLLGFSKVVALEVAEQDITINTICPAYVKTPLVEKQITQQAQEHGISEEEVENNIMLAPMPQKSFIELDELVGSVAYLLSPAAKHMTAQTLTLDGAWTAK